MISGYSDEFHDQKRGNDTHASGTDPDARLLAGEDVASIGDRNDPSHARIAGSLGDAHRYH